MTPQRARRVDNACHVLYVMKVHSRGKYSARRTREAGQWVPCPCDLCVHARKRADAEFLKATR